MAENRMIMNMVMGIGGPPCNGGADDNDTEYGFVINTILSRWDK